MGGILGAFEHILISSPQSMGLSDHCCDLSHATVVLENFCPSNLLFQAHLMRHMHKLPAAQAQAPPEQTPIRTVNPY
jgi:hypothetical protein